MRGNVVRGRLVPGDVVRGNVVGGHLVRRRVVGGRLGRGHAVCAGEGEAAGGGAWARARGRLTASLVVGDQRSPRCWKRAKVISPRVLRGGFALPPPSFFRF